MVTEAEVGESYVGLTINNAASFLEIGDKLAPHVPLGSIKHLDRPDVGQLHFIPYALRDNHGGKGPYSQEALKNGIFGSIENSREPF